MQKKNLWIIGIAIILIIIFGKNLGVFTAFYGLNEVKCSFASKYKLGCSVVGSSLTGSGEFQASTPDEIVSFQIDNPATIYAYQFPSFAEIIKDNPSLGDFFIKNTACKRVGDSWWYNGDDIRIACQSINVCESFGICTISTGQRCTSDSDTACGSLCWYPYPSKPSYCVCSFGYQSCTCSLIPQYDSKWANSILKIGTRTGEECSGVLSSVEPPPYPRTQNHFYTTNPNYLVSKFFPNQIVTLSGNIQDSRDVPTKTKPFTTNGVCDLISGVCEFRAPYVNVTEFPRSHAIINSIEINLQLNTLCSVNGVCESGETFENCPQDCTMPQNITQCILNSNCFQPCPGITPTCVNGICQYSGQCISQPTAPQTFWTLLSSLWNKFLNWLNSIFS